MFGLKTIENLRPETQTPQKRKLGAWLFKQNRNLVLLGLTCQECRTTVDSFASWRKPKARPAAQSVDWDVDWEKLLKEKTPDFWGGIFEVWPAPGARESLPKGGGRSPPHF